MIRKTITCLGLFIALLFSSIGVHAQGGGMVREYFACNYIGDADIDDLMEARDFMLQHLELGNIDPVTTFLWTPIKSNGAFDFLWFNQHDSLEAYGAGQDEYMASIHSTHIQDRFDTIVECVTGLVTHDPVYIGGDFQADPPVIASSSACTLKAGQSVADVMGVVGRYTSLIDQLGSHNESNGFSQLPLFSSAGVDVWFFQVFNDMTSWSSAENSFRSSPQAAAIGSDFNSKVSCNTSLWQAQNIVP